MDLVNRLKFYMDCKGIAISQFADSCGIPRPTMSQILNGRNKKVSDELIAKIHNSYPDLSVLWLMFGEGPMLANVNIEISEAQNGQNASSNSALNTGNEAANLNCAVNSIVGENGAENSQTLNPGLNPDSGASKLQNAGSSGSLDGFIDFGFYHSTDDTSSPLSSAAQESEENGDVPPTIPFGLSGEVQGDSAAMRPATGKRITNIVVFYSDNSFQSFFPG